MEWGDGENKPLSVILGAVSSFPWRPFAYYRWFAAKNGCLLSGCCWGAGGTKGRIPGLSPNPKLRLLFAIPVAARYLPRSSWSLLSSSRQSSEKESRPSSVRLLLLTQGVLIGVASVPSSSSYPRVRSDELR